MQADAKAGTFEESTKRPVEIRGITVADAEAVASLSEQLGYSNEVDEIRERIAIALSSASRMIYVACESHAPIGWIDVSVIHHLSSGAFGEIGGLIVATEHRGKGIGRELVTKAEQWTVAQGVTRMVVRSRVSREDAHRFYIREGYDLTKTSAVFSKKLPDIGKSGLKRPDGSSGT